MTDEHQLLSQAAHSLTRKLMGFDRELDVLLQELGARLSDKELNIVLIQQALTQIERVFSGIQDITTRNINTYIQSFDVLLNDADNKSIILEPLQHSKPTITDFLKVAAPLSEHIHAVLNSSDSIQERKFIEELKINLSKKFKSLLQTLLLMGNESQLLSQLLKILKANPDPSWKVLDEVSTRTIDILQIYLSEEKVEFQGYLEKLNSKLARINEVIETDTLTLKDLKNLNIDFNNHMSKQMAKARKKINDQSQINEVKADVIESLNSIEDKLQDHQNQSDSKLNELQKNKLAMNDQVEQLEKENLSLMAELHRERQLSMIDPLTQLPNRYGFNSRLSQELSLAERHDLDISVALIDIDFFKSINDQFGHLVGDKALKMIATEMKKISRESDYLSRYGGEEFILLLPQTRNHDAINALEKIRTHIENCPFHFQGEPIVITVSIGIAQLVSGETAENWINRADEALYESKRNGRNQSTIHSHQSEN